MRHHGNWIRHLAAGAVALVALGTAAGAGAQTTVKLAHAVSTQDPYQFGAERFKDLIDQRTSEFIELLKKNGMQVTEVDTTAFRTKASPVYKEFEARIGKELLDEVLRSK